MSGWNCNKCLIGLVIFCVLDVFSACGIETEDMSERSEGKLETRVDISVLSYPKEVSRYRMAFTEMDMENVCEVLLGEEFQQTETYAEGPLYVSGEGEMLSFRDGGAAWNGNPTGRAYGFSYYLDWNNFVSFNDELSADETVDYICDGGAFAQNAEVLQKTAETANLNSEIEDWTELLQKNWAKKSQLYRRTPSAEFMRIRKPPLACCNGENRLTELAFSHWSLIRRVS